jgi:hypothetical protein
MEPNPGNQSPFLATFTFDEIYNRIQKKFIEMLPKYEIDAAPFFIKESIPQMTGNTRQYNEIDFSSFARTKPEATPAIKAQMGLGYHKIMTMKRIAHEFDLTYEARTQNQWYKVQDITAQLIKTVPYRINLDMTHKIISFANAASYVDMDGMTIDTTTGDGLSIGNAAHTLAFSGSTYTNIVTGNPQFSKSALESALRVARNNTFDNFGVPHAMDFSHIWTTADPTLVANVKQFLNSISDGTQANPNVNNVYKNRYEHIMLNQIDTDANGFRDTSKSNWWGVAALRGSRGDRLQAYFGEWEAPNMKPAPTNGNNADDFSKDIWKYGVRAGYGLCVVRPQGIVYSFAS